jgi:thiamine biosynthesis lipoprotein
MNIKFLLSVLATVILFSCGKPPSKYIYNKGMVYGTVYSITYESPNGIDLQDKITEKFNGYNLMFSTYAKESIISKINSNQPTELSNEFIICFNKAREVSKKTNGAFDITAGAMVNAWGFGPEEKKKMTQEKVDSLIQITGYEKIKLEDGRIIKENPNIKLDMSAIAKGYTSDLIGNFLAENGCKNYMVEIGGEVAAKGINERGKIWTIGINKPDENDIFGTTELQAKVKLSDHGLATSGNYRNFYVEDGKKYAHTIDPKTGYPVQHSILSSTVIANNCMTADAYATAFMVLELEQGIEIARNIQEIEVFFIYADEQGNNQVYMSDGFGEYIIE